MYNTTHRSGGTSPYVHTILESYNVCIASSFDETYIHEDDFRELLCQRMSHKLKVLIAHVQRVTLH